jgi:vitamin B12 transporter
VAAAAVIPQTRTKVRAAYGEGVRAPSFAQLIGDGGIGFVTANPNLRPERADSWEIGLDQSLAGGRAELGVTYFHTRFDDLITFVAGASPSSQNVQAAEAQGVEFTARFRPVPGLTITGAYQYLRTKVLDNGGVAVTESPRGAPLPRQPTHGGSLTLDYVRDRLTANLTGIFVGEREDVNVLTAPPRRVTLAAYARVDTAISYVLLKDVGHLRTLGLFGKVRNLTDERYEDFFGFRAPGRTVLVGLRATF